MTFYKCISNYLWSYLADNECIKGINRGVYNIFANSENTYVKDTFISNTYVVVIFIRYVNIKDISTKSIMIKGVKPKTFVRLWIILAILGSGLRIDDCYFLSFIGLTKGISC